MMGWAVSLLSFSFEIMGCGWICSANKFHVHMFQISLKMTIENWETNGSKHANNYAFARMLSHCKPPHWSAGDLLPALLFEEQTHQYRYCPGSDATPHPFDVIPTAGRLSLTSGTVALRKESLSTLRFQQKTRYLPRPRPSSVGRSGRWQPEDTDRPISPVWSHCHSSVVLLPESGGRVWKKDHATNVRLLSGWNLGNGDDIVCGTSVWRWGRLAG